MSQSREPIVSEWCGFERFECPFEGCAFDSVENIDKVINHIQIAHPISDPVLTFSSVEVDRLAEKPAEESVEEESVEEESVEEESVEEDPKKDESKPAVKIKKGDDK